MNNGCPKISVIIICYNQEDVIRRALDSVLCQKEYIYEMIVSDDCSKDKTWDIVKDYQREYPNIIKTFRNEKNLGIYENCQSTYDKVNGEIVFFLSGDDEFGKELFKLTCEVLSKAELDYRKDKFCVITDYRYILPDGNKVVVKNNSLVMKHDPFSLKFRGIIANRAFGESISTFNEKKNVIIEKRKDFKISSSLQEGYNDNMPYRNTSFFFYIPYVGNTYYSGIGLSTKFSKYYDQYLEGLIEYCNKIPDYIDALNKYDMNWLKFHKRKSEYLLNPTFNKLFKYFLNFFSLSLDPLRNFFLLREMKIFLREIVYFVLGKDKKHLL
ncbi:MAG: glycosyltransferase family 2 protein [Lentimicrobium sp.]